MIPRLRQIIKKIVHSIIFEWIYLKSRIFYLLYNANGIGLILECLPEIYIIPLMKRYGLSIGENSRILPGVVFNHLGGRRPFSNLIIGKKVHIGRKVLFDLSDKIILDDDVALGAGCMIWTHVGDYTFDFKDYHAKVGQVTIGKAVICWSGVIVSPGITIGDYARVAAGSVVTRDVEAKSFVGGVPARFIRKRDI